MGVMFLMAGRYMFKLVLMGVMFLMADTCSRRL